ncbi:MAG: hypothetical protein JNK83_00435 [Rhizobiales bacterium]|nr:hypothetical protein [Hyphomicrobiales bacterium]
MQTPSRSAYPYPVPVGFPEWAEKVLKPETAAVIRGERKMFILALGAYRLRNAPMEPVSPGSKANKVKTTGRTPRPQ